MENYSVAGHQFQKIIFFFQSKKNVFALTVTGVKYLIKESILAFVLPRIREDLGNNCKYNLQQDRTPIRYYRDERACIDEDLPNRCAEG